MAREILKRDMLNYDKAMGLEGQPFLQGLPMEIAPWLLFRGDDQFEAMDYNSTSKPFPNGHFKRGTIRFREDKVLMPLSDLLLAFESSEFKAGERPRRYIRLDYVAICPLEELTDEEILHDGFENREDMLWQMTEMEGRYYETLTPQSLISYFAWGSPSPFSGISGSARLVVHALQSQGDYWDQLRKMDKTGWTKGIKV